jgi:dihydropteroate synthase
VILIQNRNLKADLPGFANFSLDRPLIMGIVNVTPDSFTDGGEFFGAEIAIEHGLKLIKDGADILDIGGESTRPGAVPVDPCEEVKRVLPVINELSKLGAVVSVDTRNASVMEQALEAGASIINDVSALEGIGSLEVAAKSGASVILMHMNGDPTTMMSNTDYNDIVSEINNYFALRIEACVSEGIDLERIAIDPGFGFGKTRNQNLEIINKLERFNEHLCPILVGLSRKFGKQKSAKNRLPESLAVTVKAVINGAQIVRTHDVSETRDALAAIRYEGA